MSSRGFAGNWGTTTMHLLKVAVGTLSITPITWDGVGTLPTISNMLNAVAVHCVLRNLHRDV